MDSVKGKCASSWVDLGYTNQFCVLEVTSVFFSCCDSVVGDSLEFNQANRGSLRVWLGKRNCSGHSAGESGLISQGGERLMGFLHGFLVVKGMLGLFLRWSPFRLKHKTQGPSHIHIPKGKLLLSCLWKDGLPLHSRQGISSHLQTIWGARVFHPVALLKLMFL